MKTVIAKENGYFGEYRTKGDEFQVPDDTKIDKDTWFFAKETVPAGKGKKDAAPLKSDEDTGKEPLI